MTKRDPSSTDSQIEALEARLEAATNANRVLLETLSHDLRTPLNSIIGFADMMDQEILGPVDNAQYRTYVRDIHGAGRQMLEILHDLLERQRFEQIEKSEKDFRHMFELAPDLIGVCRAGRIIRINPAGANLLGIWPVELLIGRVFADFVHADFKPLVADGLEKLTDRTTRLPMKLNRAGGGGVDVELAAIPYAGVDADTDAAGGDTVMLIARDVTERNRAIRQVAAREGHIRKIMDTVVEGILTADQNGVIETINPAAEKILGYRSGELVGRNISVLMPENAVAAHQGYLRDYPENDAVAAMGAREVEAVRKDGNTVPIEITISAMRDRDRYTFIAALHDITERKMVEARLVELATMDPLTGLPNRTAFRERLGQAVERAGGIGAFVAVLFVDLDNFRHINDTRGHVVADQVIRMAGSRLRQCLRERDTVAHMGGDEFMVILENIAGDEETRAAGQVILEVIAQPFFVEGTEIFITASIGAALYPLHGETAGYLVRNVDTALHHVKHNERGTMQFYSAELTTNIGHWVQLEAGLRGALDHGELYLDFQPKVDLETRRVIGAEALLRWRNPALGDVSPVEFVPVAEETGLIARIGDWVLVEACRQAVIWNELSPSPVHVGVNVSAHQMKAADFGGTVKLALEETGLSPRLLELELTESIMMDEAGGTVAVLEDLRRLGITVAIDDFGTGYSSLSYLTRFPLDTLKVDRAFVMNLPDDRDAMAIARSIVGMAKSLDLHVVAEGIETENQDGFLHALGCQTGQGYLFSRPLTGDGFMDFIGGNVVPMKIPG